MVTQYGSVSLVGSQNGMLSKSGAVAIALLVAVHVLVGAARRANHTGKDEQKQYSQDILFHFSLFIYSFPLTANGTVYCPAGQKRPLFHLTRIEIFM